MYREGWSNLERKLVFSWRIGALQYRRRYSKLFATTTCMMSPECAKRGGQDSHSHLLRECEYNPVPRPRDENDENQMRRYLSELNRIRCGPEIGVPLVYM